MFEVYFILFICTILAYSIRNRSESIQDGRILRFQKTQENKGLLLFLILVLIWFAGTRTRMNDTSNYLVSFQYLPSNLVEGIRSVSWSIGHNPLFNLFQVILKAFLFSKKQGLIVVSACLIQVSFVKYLHRYSYDFGFSVYLYIAFTVLAFTMAAMKQTMATAIAIWAIPYFQKKKSVKAVLLLLIAALIHPYVLILGVCYFFSNKGIWSKYIIFSIIITVIIGFSFYSVLSNVLSITDAIGENFSIESFESGTGVGILRILSYWIVPVLSFINRRELSVESDPLQDIFINLTILAACFSVLSGIGGSVYLGRLPNFFDIFICIALPYTIVKMKTEKPIGIIVLVLYLVYFLFYYTYYRKYWIAFGTPFFGSVYDRISIAEVIRTW